MQHPRPYKQPAAQLTNYTNTAGSHPRFQHSSRACNPPDEPPQPHTMQRGWQSCCTQSMAHRTVKHLGPSQCSHDGLTVRAICQPSVHHSPAFARLVLPQPLIPAPHAPSAPPPSRQGAAPWNGLPRGCAVKLAHVLHPTPSFQTSTFHPWTAWTAAALKLLPMASH